MSVGTVWSVGGLAPFTTGVSNGRGRLLGSGTNAPLYTTSFSAAKPKAQEDSEKHEGRLAEALELDRVSRVLEFREHTSSPQRPSASARADSGVELKTVWKGTEWIMNSQDQSRFLIWGYVPNFRWLTCGYRDSCHPRSSYSPDGTFQVGYVGTLHSLTTN